MDNATVTQQQQQQVPNVSPTASSLPTFVLHVGPAKTGTTEIQSQIHQNKQVKQWLAEDHFAVLTGLHRPDFYQEEHHNETTSYSFPPAFVQAVRRQRVRGFNNDYHLFGSSEYLLQLSEEQCQLWKEQILPKWKLEIVLMYRRLHHYLPSFWNQRFRYYRDKKGLPVHAKHYHWPGTNGDVRIQSFEEWYVDLYYNKIAFYDKCVY